MSARPPAELGYLCRALKAPSLAAAAPRLAERARADGWSHEEYLAACLEREVAARQSHGGEARIDRAGPERARDDQDFDGGHAFAILRQSGRIKYRGQRSF